VDGAAFCWGDNDHGQLGHGTMNESEGPARIMGVSDVVEISAGTFEACARTRDAEVYCWGRGSSQAGRIPTTQRVVDLAAQQYYLMLADSGRIYSAVRGAGSFRAVPEDVQLVDGIGPARQISSYESACAWEVAGGVTCWGSNEGHVIDGGSEGFEGQTDYPPAAIDLPPLQRLSASLANCATTVARELYCWGDRVASIKPVRMFDLTGVVEGLVQYKHACVLLQDRSVWCWGDNTYPNYPRPVINGMLGVDPKAVKASATPVRVTGIDDAIQIGIGNHFTCVLRDSGVVSCWGGNFAGQLGDGTTEPSWQPIDVLLPED